MNAIAVFLMVISMMCATSINVSGQESSESDIDHLKEQVEKQQARIQALESALAAQQQMLMKIASANSEKANLIPAVEASTANLKLAAYDLPAPKAPRHSRNNNRSRRKLKRWKTSSRGARKSPT